MSIKKTGKPPQKGGHKPARKGSGSGNDRFKTRKDDGLRPNSPSAQGSEWTGRRKASAAPNKNFPKGQASLWGVHAVTEAWRNPARKIRTLFVTTQALESFAPLIAEAETNGLKRPAPTLVERRDLDRMLGADTVHQGIALDTGPLDEVFVQDLVAATAVKESAVLLMLDQVTDPHNVGAILRSASAFGADGVIMQRRHSPDLSGVLAKTACGAVEHMPVAYEINLADTLDYLKNKGFYAAGLDERGAITIGQLKKGGKIVLVLGAEGKGLRPKVREHCDTLVRLPTGGAIASLNVSNAAAVALYAVCGG